MGLATATATAPVFHPNGSSAARAHLRRVLQQDVQAGAGACVPHAHAVVRQGGHQAAVVGRPGDLH